METTTTSKSTFRAVVIYSVPAGGFARLAERETLEEAEGDAFALATSGNLHDADTVRIEEITVTHRFID